MSHDTGTVDRSVDGSGGSTDRFVVGRDVGPWSAWFRIIFGLIAVASLWYRVDKALDGSELLVMVVWFAVITAVYTAVIWLFSRMRQFQGVSPWVPSALLQLPMLLYPLDIGSDPFHQAMACYTTSGVLICGLMRYGGLEVAALPALLLRRRFHLYSPFNTVDIVEQAFTRRESGRGAMWITALTVTVFCFVQYWMVALFLSIPPMKDAFGESIKIAGFWVLLLLIPFVFFAMLARRGRTPGRRGLSAEGRWPALAALSLLVLMPMLATRQVPDSLWGIIMLVGLVVGLVTLVRFAGRGASRSSRKATLSK